MKKIFFLGAFILASNFMFAQNMEAATKRAEARTESMSSSLQLTAEQKERVKQLLTGIEMKMEAVNAEPSFTADQRAEQVQGNKNAEMQILKEILTEEQYARHEASLKAGTRKVGAKTDAPVIKQKATN